jgi:hypothetical protein
VLGVPAPADPVHCPPTSPHDLSVYAAYLRRLLLHFAGRVAYYESWVEPNHSSMWAGGVNPAQYATLLEAEYRVFQASDPQDKLMFAGVADFGIEDGSPSGIAVLPYTEQVLDDLHGQTAFDLVALHGYRYPAVALARRPRLDPLPGGAGLASGHLDGAAGGLRAGVHGARLRRAAACG